MKPVMIGQALCGVLVMQLCAATITVDPNVRHQTYLGLGGTTKTSTYDYSKAINEWGLNVHRVHLDERRTTAAFEAKTSKAVADAAGIPMVYIGSIWSPPPELKIGPFVTPCGPNDDRYCGGTLDTTKYAEFADHMIGRIKHFKDSGIDLYAISLQNEPWLAVSYMSCTYTKDSYADMFAGVAPLVKAAYPDVKLMFCEKNTRDKTGYEIPTLSSEACKPYYDFVASHGMENDDVYADAHPDDIIAKLWKTKHSMTVTASGGFVPWSQTECNNVCGWDTGGDCSDGWGTTKPAWQEACNILCMFRYGYGQIWTCYDWELQFDSSPDRVAVYKQFAKTIDPGAEMIDCTQDTAGNVATVAFHDKVRKTLNVVFIKGKGSTASVTFDIPGLATDGHWRMTNATDWYKDMGTVGVGQTITPPEWSVNTVYWIGYDPDISAATYPVTGGPTDGTAAGEPLPAQHGYRGALRPAHTVSLYDLSGRLVGRRSAGDGPSGDTARRPLLSVYRDRQGTVVGSVMRIGL